MCVKMGDTLSLSIFTQLQILTGHKYNEVDLCVK